MHRKDVMYTELVKTLPLSYMPVSFYIHNENMKWEKVDIDTKIIEDVAAKVNGYSQYSPDFFMRGSYANVCGRARFYINPEGRWVLYITGVPKSAYEPYKKLDTQTTLYCEDQTTGYLIQIILPAKEKLLI